MTNATYTDIANDYNLWIEYVDTDATMTESEFDAMSEAEKLTIMNDAFGAE